MSKPLKFAVQDVPQGKQRGKSRAPSASQGPVVVLKGWREGMNKVAVTRLLRSHGVPLSEAYDATNTILDGQAASVQLREGTDVKVVCQGLNNLGVVV
jgi:hypothetical protein